MTKAEHRPVFQLMFTFLATFIVENSKVPLMIIDEQNHAWVKNGVKKSTTHGAMKFN